jgi:hypothetical protein
MQLKRSRRFLLIGNLLLPALLGLGAIGLNPTPAQACGDIYANPPRQVLPPFGFQNGVRLGLNEADTLKILGEPQDRQGPGTRCGSPRQRLSYPSKTLLVLDLAQDVMESPGGEVRYIPPTAAQAQRRNAVLIGAKSAPLAQPPGTGIAVKRERVIVRFATQDPELVFSQDIRVGDRAEKLLQAYGEPQNQSTVAGFTTLRYQQHKEILFVTLEQDRITRIELMLQTPIARSSREISLFDQPNRW